MLFGVATARGSALPGMLCALPAPLTPACPSPSCTRLQSLDTETAGAAFVTLMALMGDDAAAGLSSSSAASGLLPLDAHFGVPGAAPGEALPACKLDCVPTDGQLMDALRANGYSPQAGGSSGGRGGRQPVEQRQQQQGAAGPAGAGQQEEGARPPKMVRVQAIKLILRTAAAMCRYCAKASPGRGGAACSGSRSSPC